MLARPAPKKPSGTLDLSFVVTPSLCQNSAAALRNNTTRCGKEGSDVNGAVQVHVDSRRHRAAIGGVILYGRREHYGIKDNAVGPPASAPPPPSVHRLL